ncbi:MAG TPA: hypothetical protein PK286_07005 [Devosia sp.]|nr:hypothetical protein [Devosia sp.]
MRNSLTGRRPAFSAVIRTVLVSSGLVAALALSACTTTEGTNALTDFGTFEREVMNTTLQGVGVLPREAKAETNQRRAPLALPKGGAALPQPGKDTQVAVLPTDSNRPQIDMTGLTEADLKRLRNARVVDLHTLSGRPLTEAEAKQLTARMTAARVKSGSRPLYMPPEDYFTHVEGKDLVCISKAGQVVPLDSKDCPYEIKKAIVARGGAAMNPGILGSGPTTKKD